MSKKKYTKYFLITFIVLIFFGTSIYAAMTLGDVSKNWILDTSYIQEGQRTDFEKELAKNVETLKTDPENLDALLDAGYYNQLLGYLKPAEKYYKKVLKIDPKNFRALSNLATVYEYAKVYNKASDTVERLYNVDPNNLETGRDAVRLHLLAGRVGKAEAVAAYFRKNNDMTRPENKNELQNYFEQIERYKGDLVEK